MNRIFNDVRTVKRLVSKYIEDVSIKRQARDAGYVYDSIFAKKSKGEILNNVKTNLSREIISILNKIEEVGYLDENKIPALTASPTISVVIPHYNQYDYLDETLQHLADQSDLPDEVVVVDDISDDSARVKMVVEKHKEKLSIKFLPNPGKRFYPGRARQYGAENAIGDVIALHDHDDISHVDRIKFVRKFFNIHREALQLDVGFVRFREKFFDYVKNFDVNLIENYIIPTEEIKEVMKERFVKQLFTIPNHNGRIGYYGSDGKNFFGVHDGSTTFRRDVAKYLKQPAPDDYVFTKFESYDFALMLLLLGQRSFQLDLPLIYYRLGYRKNREEFKIY